MKINQICSANYKTSVLQPTFQQKFITPPKQITNEVKLGVGALISALLANKCININANNNAASPIQDSCNEVPEENSETCQITENSDVAEKMMAVNDERLLDYLEKFVHDLHIAKEEGDSTLYRKAYLSITQIAELYHTLKGNYARTFKTDMFGKSKETQLMAYLHCHNEKEQQELLESDFFKNSQKSEMLKEICGTNNSEEMVDVLNYLYNQYYLKNINVDENVKDKCMELNEKYGVKIFICDEDVYDDDILPFLKLVDYEFANWKKAGKGKEKLPKVLDLERNDPIYMRKSPPGGYFNALANTISLDGIYVQDAINLRHELVHCNDLNIITEKIGLLHGDIQETFKEIQEQKKYYDEIQSSYAYKSRAEFLAEAVKNVDMKNISDDLKSDLLFLGMPEFILNLPYVTWRELYEIYCPDD